MSDDDLLLQEAAEQIRNASYLVAFTGAGISVESGIPPFRGEGGIWSRYDPNILDIGRYLDQPDETWPVINELFYNFFSEARPNHAHHFLAFLEKKGYLKTVVTQNIDNLHQEAGSTRVIEYHGNSRFLACTACGEKVEVTDEIIKETVPLCRKDGNIMKPDFVFFGEAIPEHAASMANAAAEKADVMIVIGTTGEVMPASLVPRLAKNTGSTVIEINPSETAYTAATTDIFLKGKAAEICQMLQKMLDE